MNKENLTYLTNSFALVLSAIQDNPIFQAVSFILTILSFLVSIAYTIYKWYVKAKKDGKITLEEIKELHEDLTKKEQK